MSLLFTLQKPKFPGYTLHGPFLGWHNHKKLDHLAKLAEMRAAKLLTCPWPTGASLRITIYNPSSLHQSPKSCHTVAHPKDKTVTTALPDKRLFTEPPGSKRSQYYARPPCSESTLAWGLIWLKGEAGSMTTPHQWQGTHSCQLPTRQPLIQNTLVRQTRQSWSHFSVKLVGQRVRSGQHSTTTPNPPKWDPWEKSAHHQVLRKGQNTVQGLTSPYDLGQKILISKKQSRPTSVVLRQHQHLARRFCYQQDLDSFKGASSGGHSERGALFIINAGGGRVGENQSLAEKVSNWHHFPKQAHPLRSTPLTASSSSSSPKSKGAIWFRVIKRHLPLQEGGPYWSAGEYKSPDSSSPCTPGGRGGPK